ncbi:MAG TPA: hypothetical protein VD962_07245 [Rubricoccaceae bacterium]|nr:hypothetical protein [Rubricoccaceae bacterium]
MSEQPPPARSAAFPLVGREPAIRALEESRDPLERGKGGMLEDEEAFGVRTIRDVPPRPPRFEEIRAASLGRVIVE